jgi:TolA-binding protein
MPEEIHENSAAKAEIFFERARKIAQTDNFDYAIDMYLEGLRRSPEAVEEGHVPLRELAIARRSRKAGKPTIADRIKRLRGKTPLEQMINAEYLFAKDPDHAAYAGAMLKAAAAGGYNKTAKWIADLLFHINNTAERPSLQTYVLLKDTYWAIGQVDRAVMACQCAAKIKPGDTEIAAELKNLSAELAVSRGGYDKAGDFTHSIKDRQAQEKLQAQEAVVKTESYRLAAVEQARRALEADPEKPARLFALAEALADMQADEAENEGIGLLEGAFEKTGDFTFKQRAGQLRIRQLKRKIRALKSPGGEGKGDDAAAAGLSSRLGALELEHYRSCVEHYPTDATAKYEYAQRLFENKRYDEAIPLFQDSQRDPRHRTSAAERVGTCFLMKGWFADAVDVFTKAIETYPSEDDAVAKHLRYSLARAHESAGDGCKALDLYRRIAQMDFMYKDVRHRIDKIRQAADPGPAGNGGPRQRQ